MPDIVPIRIVFVFLVLAATACTSRQTYEKVEIGDDQLATYLEGKPEALRPGFKKIIEEGQRNFVLNHMQIGMDAILRGYFDTAKSSFDHCLTSIEAVYANNETARKARSLWYEEGMKNFKGEPYERAMAYFYRGLLFIRDGDFENARACFKTGIIQDAFAEEYQHRCDFALLLLMEGYCSMLLGDHSMAKAAFNEVRQLRPDFTVPIQQSNLVILFETGASPRKLADGIGHGELKFFRGRNILTKTVSCHLDDGNSSSAYRLEDIAWQAMTRGGRPVDKIIAGKVHFRERHADIGANLTDISTRMIILSPATASPSTIQGVGAALGLFGTAEMAIAARTRPHADTRYWNNLPDTMHLAALNAAPGFHRLKMCYYDSQGEKVGEEMEPIAIPAGQPATITFLWKRKGYPPLRMYLQPQM